MKYQLLWVFFFIFGSSFVYSQSNDSSASKSPVITPTQDQLPSSNDNYQPLLLPGTSSKDSLPTNYIYLPTIGFGTGMFSFYGDLYKKHFQAPMVSRIALEFSISQYVNDYLQLNFYLLSGKLGADERFVQSNRNSNFESKIRAGGINVLYNFNNFIQKEHTACPYVTIGLEAFEFVSKTDLYDKYGNKYYYWSDGSIRNIDQIAPDANAAILLHRDYTYESDLREMNLDKFGKYPERSWALPIGTGVIFNINKDIDFKLGATMHFTFTDYIDGITEKSSGNRVGNKRNDNYMMTSFSLHYNFGNTRKEEIMKREAPFKDVDFLALDQLDTDKDRIVDVNDMCPGTPEGVTVDTKGCPLDDDGDGVPNYKDEQKNTPAGAIVDIKGMEMNDSLIAYYQTPFADTSGHPTVEYHFHGGSGIGKAFTSANVNQREYMVEIGKYNKGLQPELMTKFLSINDIASTNINDSTTLYTAGKFYTVSDAQKRQQQLTKDGVANTKIVYKENGKFYDLPANTNSSDNISNSVISSSKNINTPGIVLRVQLGAFRKKLSKNVFKDIPNVVEIKTADGFYKYTTGSFTNFDAAAKHKVDMVLKGYPGAFIVAFKDGKPISLKEAGATAPTNKEVQLDAKDSTLHDAVNKKLVVFKVQVGIFKNDPPEDKLAIFSKIKDLNGEEAPNGLTRYVVGSFKDYKSAEAYKNEIVKNYGLKDAFVVAFFNKEYISIQEALELMK